MEPHSANGKENTSPSSGDNSSKEVESNKFKGLQEAEIECPESPHLKNKVAEASLIADAVTKTNVMNDAQGDELTINVARAASIYHTKAAQNHPVNEGELNIDFNGENWLKCITECTLYYYCPKTPSPPMRFRQTTDSSFPNDVDGQIQYFIDRATRLKPYFDKALRLTFTGPGACINVGPVKLAKRCLEKLKEDNANATQIYDYLRATITYVDIPSLVRYFHVFQQDHDALRIKSRLVERTTGNRCILVNCTVGTPACYLIAEIQMTTKNIADLNKFAHDFYAGSRATGGSGTATPVIPTKLEAAPAPGKYRTAADKAKQITTDRDNVLRLAAHQMAEMEGLDPWKVHAGLLSIMANAEAH